MKREEYDEDDVSDSEREGAQEKTLHAVCAKPWNGGRTGSPPPGAAPCISAQVPAQVPSSISDATTIVPLNLRT